jgi:hypothetical protein
MTIWAAWQPTWLLYDKVSFDGTNKIIYVHPEVTALDIRADVYSSWIDWHSQYQNSEFLLALRYTGLDPIGAGVFTGDSYFLINGWKLSVDLQKVRVSGVLFSDDYDTAYYTPTLVAQYPATVSSLVTTVSTGPAGVGTVAQVADAVWSANNLATYGVGSAGVKLDSVGASANPWNTDLSSYTTANTAGKILRDAGLDATLAKTQTDTVEATLATLQGSIGALPADVRTEMDANSVKLAQIKAIIESMSIPTAAQNADAVWTAPVSTMTDKTTIGGWIHKVLLTIPTFMGIK